jgi:hypothetical protein
MDDWKDDLYYYGFLVNSIRHSTEHHEYMDQVKEVLLKGFEINKHYYPGGNELSRVLSFSIEHGTKETLELLLKSGGDPNFGDDFPSDLCDDKFSILERAFVKGRDDYVEILLEFGADPKFIRNDEVQKRFYEKYSEKYGGMFLKPVK